MPESTNDPGRLKFIEAFLDFPIDLNSSTHLKIFCTMGDRVAISLANLVSPTRELDQIRRSKILYTLKVAFRYPEMIENQADRIPHVALWVLEVLALTAVTAEQFGQVEQVRQILYEAEKWNGPSR